MPADPNLVLVILSAMALFGWLMVKLVTWLKTKTINTELWCTVFEGLTQGAIRLDDLKQPEACIEKKTKREGLDLDTLELDASQKLPGKMGDKSGGSIS